MPLVVDNGTGVREAVVLVELVADSALQFVKCGWAGSNFPEHGEYVELFGILVLTLPFSVPFHRRSAYPACGRTSGKQHRKSDQGHHDRR